MSPQNTVMQEIEALGAACRYVLLSMTYDALLLEKNRDGASFQQDWLLMRCKELMPMAHLEIEEEAAREHAQVMQELDDAADR